jgi:hypothetical protein
MTILGFLEAVLIAPREGIQIDRLLFEKSRGKYAILQENCLLTANHQMVVQDLVFVKNSWLGYCGKSSLSSVM